MNDVARDLTTRLAGEVRFDDMSRVLYSTDASIYQVEPIGVVIPRTVEEIIATVKASIADYKAPRRVVFVDEVYRAPNGKADYRWARDQAVAAT